MHNDPNDPDFVSVTVLIRDKRMVRDGKNYHRIRIPVWQQLISVRCTLDKAATRRYGLRGLLQERESLCGRVRLQLPGQTSMHAGQRPGLGWRRYVPGKRRPTGHRPASSCPFQREETDLQKWFNGPVNDDKVPTIGRDWMQIFDFCVEGDEDPTCEGCSSIDWPKRDNNRYWKHYKAQTMSCVAPNRRDELHAYNGSALRFESESEPSEVYSEGNGHIQLQGATCEVCPKGHWTHYPNGNFEIQSETSSMQDNLPIGARIKVFSRRRHR